MDKCSPRMSRRTGGGGETASEADLMSPYRAADIRTWVASLTGRVSMSKLSVDRPSLIGNHCGVGATVGWLLASSTTVPPFGAGIVISMTTVTREVPPTIACRHDSE